MAKQGQKDTNTTGDRRWRKRLQKFIDRADGKRDPELGNRVWMFQNPRVYRQKEEDKEKQIEGISVKKNILIVDDEKAILTMLKQIVEEYIARVSVITAEDGITAIEKLKENEVSLVVTNIKMPKLDGFGLLDYIKKHYPHIPVIILTALGNPEMEKQAREGGAVEFIKKPFDIEHINRVITKTLGERVL